MKLTGSVQVCNRLAPPLNLSSNRSQISCLMIGKFSSKSDVFIIHQTTQNKNGTKYKVFGNIENVFCKFAHEGKATIRFKAPPHDLVIKSDALLLKTFLRALKVALSGETSQQIRIPVLLSDAKMPKMPKKKLVVCDKRDYPYTEGFPITLEYLKISNAEQKRVDSRILRLKYLHTLDLTCNTLTKLPEEFNLANLCSLFLADNNLGDGIINDWKWLQSPNLQKKLQILDLRRNQMKFVPRELAKFRNLTQLILSSNLIQSLPPGIGNITTLRNLAVANNLLKSLPITCKKLSLQELDIAGNKFEFPESSDEFNFPFPTLAHLSARAVLRHRLPYSYDDLPRTLVNMLDSASYCLCGSACFESTYQHHIPIDLNLICATLISSQLNGTVIPMSLVFCSRKCARKIWN